MKKSDLDLFFKIQKSLEKIEQQNQGDILRTYARALRDINKKVKDIYIRYAKDGVLSNTDKTVLNQMASIEKQAASILGKKHSEVENMINQRARLSYGESFFRHAYFIDKTANLNLDWGTIPTNAVEFAFNNDYKLLVKGQTFKKALNSSLAKVQDVFSTALIEGKSYQEVARNLVKVLGVEAVGFDAARYVGHGVSSWALMTSRTELHRAAVQGQQKTFETAKENGIDVKQVWCATLDGRTRLEHGHLDGQYKNEKEDGWWVPELSAFVKGPNQSGFPSFDINCRCCVRPEVMGLKPEERYVRDEGITKYKNYDEWKKSQFKEVEKTHILKVNLTNKAISTNIKIVTSTGIEIKGFYNHFEARIKERNISFESVIDAFENPLDIIYRDDGIKFIGKETTACLDKNTHEAKTAWKTGSKVLRKISQTL